MDSEKQKRQEALYDQFLKEYENYQAAYKKYIRGGLLAIVATAIIFMLLMFSMESKVVFLVLWIISILLSAAFLIYIEYKGYQYRRLLGIEEETDEEC